MSYEERLNESIKFLSPNGREFEAQWRGDNRTKSKKLGAFSPPKRKGTIFQDLDISATKYPLNFIFDGENHDLVARLFFETCSENGVWKVTHPTHGLLNLQLVTVTEKNQVISNANYTEFESEWVEPLDDDVIVSSAELAEQIEEQLIKLNESAAAQLEDVSDQTTASRIQALKDAAETAMAAITSGLETISELSADISRITNSIQRATTTNLLNPLISINSLASQIQIAAQIPSLAVNNISERVSSYSNVLDVFSANNPEEPTPENKNSLAIKEISMISVLGTFPRIAASGPLATRQEAVNLAELLSDLMDDVTNNLDLNQDLYSGNLLENQYFSQSQSYSDLIKLMSLGIEYLLTASFDLKVEKKFVLERARTPIDITISEYGDLGDNDSNLDLFLASNNLKNNEILLLNAGKEVVVYV